jgi:hypothetical protein
VYLKSEPSFVLTTPLVSTHKKYFSGDKREDNGDGVSFGGAGLSCVLDHPIGEHHKKCEWRLDRGKSDEVRVGRCASIHRVLVPTTRK